MNETWIISTEDAETVCAILQQFMQDNNDSVHAEAVKAVHAALYWAETITIED